MNWLLSYVFAKAAIGTGIGAACCCVRRGRMVTSGPLANRTFCSLRSEVWYKAQQEVSAVLLNPFTCCAICHFWSLSLLQTKVSQQGFHSAASDRAKPMVAEAKHTMIILWDVLIPSQMEPKGW